MKNELENHNFVRDGASRLPPGFRFQPTDEELVFQYLKSKILHLPLPATIIPDLLHVSNFDPWALPGDEEQERYFFTKKEAKYRIGNRTNRSTPCGYWKATSSDKQIRTTSHTHNMGMKGLRKTLVIISTGSFILEKIYNMRVNIINLINKPRKSFCPSSHIRYNTLNLQCSSMELEEWLICHIYKKDAVISYSVDVDGKYEMNHHESGSASSSSSSSSSPTGLNEISSSDRGLEFNNGEGGSYSNYYQYRY
ncbi:hypothetical protein V2J09_006898 [Rumex salicifolius]